MTYSLSIQFTSYYTGNHRICWRFGSSGAYDCSTVIACAGGAATCSTTILVGVSDESCDDVLIEGYVQPTCVGVDEETSRTYFTAVFNPEPPCSKFLLTCASSGISGVTLTNPGSGYTPSSSISWTTSGGGGAGAYGSALIDISGSVSTVLITNAGSGYTSSPTIIFTTSSGVTATGTGNLAPCNGLDLGTDCGDVSVFLTGDVGDEKLYCFSVAPEVSGGWTVEESGCCYTCSTVTFENTGLISDTIYYINCLTLAYTSLVLDPSDTVTVCAVTDSWTGVGPNTTVTAVSGCVS